MASEGRAGSAAVAAQPRVGFWKRSEQVLGRDWRAGWLFFLPTIILLFLLVGWPFLVGFYISFTRTIGSTVTIGPWVGLENYIALIHDHDFWFSLWITVQFTFWAEVFKPILGIIAALLLHNMKRYRAIFSALILLPWIVPGIVQALIWRALYDPIFGAINYILNFLGITANFAWLGDPNMALWAVIIVNIWAGIPFFCIVQLAGLKAIDPELYAASAVDGANAWQRFRYITIPGIAYVQIVASMLSVVWTMNNYQAIYLLTSGGPVDATRVIGILSFERAFSSFDFGSGAAISLILLPIFGFLIWVLAAYMMGGTQAGGSDDKTPLQIRIVTPIVRPLGRFFSLLFDGGEYVFHLAAMGLRAINRRSASDPAMGARAGKIVLGTVSTIVLCALLFFELLPFYWVIVSAFKTDPQISRVTSIFWPDPWTLTQFTSLLGTTQFPLWYGNTVQVAVIATIIGVLGSATGAYALTRMRWRGSGTMSGLMLISYMMPGAVMLIPFYKIMVALHLINTLQALEVLYPSFLLPFATWLLMSYYRSIPMELEDAARIDGANRLQIFWQLILPLAKPALFAVTLFAVTSAWNEFFLAYILITDGTKFTLSVGLYQMVVGDIYPIGQMMAASLLMAVPVIIIYGFAQKYMVEGLTIGSVKG